MRTLATVAAALMLVGLLAACSGNGGLEIQDGSGQEVQIGGDTAAVGGPGSPGWPEPSGPMRRP